VAQTRRPPATGKFRPRIAAVVGTPRQQTPSLFRSNSADPLRRTVRRFGALRRCRSWTEWDTTPADLARGQCVRNTTARCGRSPNKRRQLRKHRPRDKHHPARCSSSGSGWAAATRSIPRRSGTADSRARSVRRSKAYRERRSAGTAAHSPSDRCACIWRRTPRIDPGSTVRRSHRNSRFHPCPRYPRYRSHQRCPQCSRQRRPRSRHRHSPKSSCRRPLECSHLLPLHQHRSWRSRSRQPHRCLLLLRDRRRRARRQRTHPRYRSRPAQHQAFRQLGPRRPSRR
jgi:hypothetical protein